MKYVSSMNMTPLEAFSEVQQLRRAARAQRKRASTKPMTLSEMFNLIKDQDHSHNGQAKKKKR